MHAEPGEDGWSPVRLVAGRPHLARGFTARDRGRRTYGALARVAAVPPGRAGTRVQYWSFAGVSDDVHREQLDAVGLSYDVTVISAQPMGWELPKTKGHVHSSRSPNSSYPELYEVLAGEAGFLVQHPRPGPSADFVGLISATRGDIVLVPPFMQHVTINLGTSPLIVADVVCEESVDVYQGLEAAHGMAYYLAAEGVARVNERYLTRPELARFSAAEWSGQVRGSLLSALNADADRLAWLCEPASIWVLPDPSRRPVVETPHLPLGVPSPGIHSDDRGRHV